MSQKLHVYDFKWVEDISEFDKSFINNYNEEIDQGYFLEVDIQYPENLFNLHNDLPLLSERMKTEKLEKLVARLHNKTECGTYKRNFMQALNHRLVLKKVQRMIKFN